MRTLGLIADLLGLATIAAWALGRLPGDLQAWLAAAQTVLLLTLPIVVAALAALAVVALAPQRLPENHWRR